MLPRSWLVERAVGGGGEQVVLSGRRDVDGMDALLSLQLQSEGSGWEGERGE